MTIRISVLAVFFFGCVGNIFFVFFIGEGIGTLWPVFDEKYRT